MLIEASPIILDSRVPNISARSPKWSASGPTMRRTATGAIILAEMRAIFCKNTQGTAQQPPWRERVNHDGMGWKIRGEKNEGEGEL